MARLVATCSLTLVFLAALLGGPPVYAQAWLANGGFENGTAGWFVSQGATPACGPMEGNGAIGVGVQDGVEARLIAEIVGPLPNDEYTLSGWLRVQSGSAEVELELGFIRPGGLGISSDHAVLSTGAAYAPFSLTAASGFAPEAIRIVFAVNAPADAEVCFDNLSLTTPDPTPTPTPTSSPVIEPTATPTLEPTLTPDPVSPTSTPTASATPTPTTPSTATTVPAGHTATSTQAPPSFVFSNGGFEQGLAGWSKYGGELTTTTDAFSGATAGLLVSDTDSTKWAYQSVVLDAGAFYEMTAYVRPGAAASQALLRVSWYATGDASGSALATTDSTGIATGGGYVYLTTGAVKPPAGAVSARPRVLLVPSGAGRATLAIDDVWFGTVAAPTPTPTHSPSPTATIAATSSPAVAPTQPPIAVTTAGVPPTAAVPAEPAAISSGAAADTIATSTPEAADAPLQSSPAVPVQQVNAVAYVPPDATPYAGGTARQEEVAVASRDRRLPWDWFLGFALVVIGVTGTVLQRRGVIR